MNTVNVQSDLVNEEQGELGKGCLWGFLLSVIPWSILIILFIDFFN